MSAGPGWEPCTKRPRWGAAGTSAPTASDSRSFPGRQRRVLDPKDAPVQFRVPPSSPACVSGRAGPHRGNATSFESRTLLKACIGEQCKSWAETRAEWTLVFLGNTKKQT
uniref:Poly (ADP-ribose) glycohydrolase n=1 Tax=Mus spicilegus TaxID=10103 RepID=A0A8C6H1S5_MUSSI